MPQVVGGRVVVVFQLEFLIEVVTVLSDIVFGSLGAGFALLQTLLALGNFGGLGGLDGFGLMDSRNAIGDVALGAQQ